MKLDEFVSQTLVDIHNGLAKAREVTNRKYHVDSSKNGVNFDVAVLANSSNALEAEGKAKIGIIEVLGAGVSTKASKSSESGEVSRIQFSVQFPSRTEQEEAISDREYQRNMELQKERNNW